MRCRVPLRMFVVLLLMPAVAALNGANGQQSGEIPTYESSHLVRTPVSHFSKFGESISIQNDLLAVAAPMAVVDGTSAGAVYIYRHVNDIWEFEARLTHPSDSEDGEEFGKSVAIVADSAGEQLVVGSPSPQAGGRPGRVFVFERTGMEWSLAQALSGSSSGEDRFGVSLSTDGQVLAVGAPGGGAVYVFDRTAEGEYEIAGILPHSGPQFIGVPVIAAGNTVVSGTSDFESNPITIHVYEKEPDGWEFDSVISTPRSARIGAGLAFDSNYLLVQSTIDPEYGVTAPGVYVYMEVGASWDSSAVIRPPHGGSATSFGQTISLQNGMAIIGAHADSAFGENVGAAYVYALQDTTSTLLARLVPRGTPFDTHLCSRSLGADERMVACSGWHDAREAVFIFSLADSLALSSSPPPRRGSLGAQIYPNPASADVTVELSLEESDHARIAVYDMLGRLIQVLEDDYLPVGNYSLRWHPSGLASGVYLIRIETSSASTSLPITLRP